MSPVERRLRLHHRRPLAAAVAVSIAVHVVLLIFFVAPIERLEAERPSDILVIEERILLPPPPEEPARPAEPVIAEAEIDEQNTIAESVLTEATPTPPGLPEIAPDEAEEGFIFVPRTVEPRCRENCSGQAILGHFPNGLRQAGVSCALVLGLRIDTSGRVTATQVLRPSDNTACDRAAEAWALTTGWTTAYNRDEPVAVWIAQPIEVRSR